MEMTMQERAIYVKGIQALIRIEQRKILKIELRTKDDYDLEVSFALSSGNTFSLEEAKAKDILVHQKEIFQYQNLIEKMDSGQHHILCVPNFIKLNLTN